MKSTEIVKICRYWRLEALPLAATSVELKYLADCLLAEHANKKFERKCKVPSLH